MDIIRTGRRPASLLSRSRGFGYLGQTPAGAIEVPFPEPAAGTAQASSVTGYTFEDDEPYAKVYYFIGYHIAYLIQHLNNGGKIDFLIDIALGTNNNGKTDANEITGQRIAAWTILANPQWAYLPSGTYCVEQSSWTSFCTRGTGYIDGKAVVMGRSSMVAAEDEWGADKADWDSYAKTAFSLGDNLYGIHGIDAGTFAYKPTALGTLLVVSGGVIFAVGVPAGAVFTAGAGSVAAAGIATVPIATGLYLDIEGVGVNENDAAAEICRRGAIYWADYCASGLMKFGSDSNRKIWLQLPKKDMTLTELYKYRVENNYIYGVDIAPSEGNRPPPPPEEASEAIKEMKADAGSGAKTDTSLTSTEESKFPWGWVIGGVVVLGLGIGGYVWYSKSKKQ